MEYFGGVIQGNDVNYGDYYFDADFEKGECALEGLRGKHFTLPDYIIFGILFMGTILIGLFYGCFRGRKSTASEYLMGNRQMHYVPVAMSLISGLLSAVSVLGNPAEMYNYGSQLYMFCLAFLISTPVAVSIYVPIYQKLEITSVFEVRHYSSILCVYPAPCSERVPNF
ncbi:hypothetical protein J437_LFUL016936 [Ladona fulva]|uniref:Sodium-coupled monocarboxylate transporter 1 n=1 Tax=Ladona fulva TaxID=123851 RepID=A0A8K0KJJ2_LADFU|nr:hypothetical protein J437_LFUL016936 [Ladona fulva]